MSGVKVHPAPSWILVQEFLGECWCRQYLNPLVWSLCWGPCPFGHVLTLGCCFCCEPFSSFWDGLSVQAWNPPHHAGDQDETTEMVFDCKWCDNTRSCLARMICLVVLWVLCLLKNGKGEERKAVIYCSTLLKQSWLQLLQSWQMDKKGSWNQNSVKVVIKMF